MGVRKVRPLVSILGNRPNFEFQREGCNLWKNMGNFVDRSIFLASVIVDSLMM